ncbi:MAG: zinc ribbon domain-containing protein [Prevotellaceae bacterium]|nr:zinc ribbon domain-containing protein [Prevotellaceae bacterium]
MLIKCPECGNQVSDKARKCPHCGIRLKKRSYAWVIFLLILAVVVLCAGTYIYYQQSKQERMQERLEYVMNCGDVEEMQEYLDLNPELPEVKRKAIERKIAQLNIVQEAWNDAVGSESRSALVAFVRRFPDDAHVHEANNMIDSLDWVTAKRANTEDAYQTYMEHHSNGNFYYDAHNAMKKIREEIEEAERRSQALSDSIDRYFENEADKD